MHRHADTSKAKNELGFVPTSIEEAIREQYEWFIADGHIIGRSAPRIVDVSARPAPVAPAKRSSKTNGKSASVEVRQ